jgi:peptidoglycan/xylan/chitin deacetylase (PgdA/CDA1 family)/folate-dependent phosphoribosylglycinamide formyltransferase PurN
VFRIIIFTSETPQAIRIFLKRVLIDLPEVTIAGVIYERGASPLPAKTRIKQVFKNICDPDFLGYSIEKVAGILKAKLTRLLDIVVRTFHAAPPRPNGEPTTLSTVKVFAEEKGIPFLESSNIHSDESLQFTRLAQADLGIVYGTRILREKLFSIPRLGSINIHKHKLPDYRGAGTPGLWEMRDGRTEQTVSVHRVLKEVDAGVILGEKTFPIEPFDTLTSVGLKAYLLANDCLVEVIRRESRGETSERAQGNAGKVYKGYQSHQIWGVQKTIKKRLTPFRPKAGRPLIKLLARFAFFPKAFFRNRRWAKRESFPITILFHHLITDRPHFLGMSTENFSRQVKYLKKHYKIASLADALTSLRSGKVPEPTVVLTFDDGYEANHLGLRAVVEAEEIPIALFLSTKNVEDRSPFAHDEKHGEVGFNAMSWDQVRDFERHGVTLGSHTRTHFDCGSDGLPAEYYESEVVGPQEDFQREIGRKVSYFSFPWGYPCNMNPATLALARRAYQVAFSAYGGVNQTPLRENAILRRASHPASLLELELLLQGLLEFERKNRDDELEAKLAKVPCAINP